MGKEIELFTKISFVSSSWCENEALAGAVTNHVKLNEEFFQGPDHRHLQDKQNFALQQQHCCCEEEEKLQLVCNAADVEFLIHHWAQLRSSQIAQLTFQVYHLGWYIFQKIICKI